MEAHDTADDRAAPDAADEAMRALAEPRRRAILQLVAHRELAAGEIAAAFDVNRTTVSQHLTVLKQAGLLAERRDGTRRLYPAHQTAAGLRAFLDDIWSSSLDVARQLVEDRAPEFTTTIAKPMPDERRIETTAMSSDAEPGTTGEIVVLRRPPIRQATIIRADRNDSFDSFVRHIGAWWPVRTISIGRERVRDVTLEPRLGGRLYETWDDDTTIEWGTVMAWNPPDRFLISWLNTPVPTEVEFRFTRARSKPHARLSRTSRVGGVERRAAQRRLRSTGRLPLGCVLAWLGTDSSALRRSRRRGVSRIRRTRATIVKCVVLYHSSDDVIPKAMVHFAAHIAWADQFKARGTLLMLGTFADVQADGSMAIFTTRQAAEAFVARDPFVAHGVVSSYLLRDWNEQLVPDQ